MDRTDVSLSPMALEILALHASGYRLKEISKKVYLSYPRVTGIAGEAKRELGVKTLAGAVIRAHDLGLLSHPTGAESRVFVLEPLES